MVDVQNFNKNVIWDMKIKQAKKNRYFQISIDINEHDEIYVNKSKKKLSVKQNRY